MPGYVDPMLMQQMFRSPNGQQLPPPPPGQGGTGPGGPGAGLGPSFQGPDQFAPAGVQPTPGTYAPPPGMDPGMVQPPPYTGDNINQLPPDVAPPQGRMGGGAAGALQSLPPAARQRLIQAIMQAQMGRGG